jgi:hypothetical protein
MIHAVDPDADPEVLRTILGTKSQSAFDVEKVIRNL